MNKLDMESKNIVNENKATSLVRGFLYPHS